MIINNKDVESLHNTATGTNSLTILGDKASYTGSVNIGPGSQATNVCGVAVGRNAKSTASSATAIGHNSKASAYCSIALGGSNSVDSTSATGEDSIAIGHYARASQNSSIQIGYGQNNDANTLSIGLSHSNNYKLLESDGTIPTTDFDSSTTQTLKNVNGTIKWVSDS